MATVKEKINKDNSRSFEIRVSLGRDLNQKQLLKYYTWSPPPGMTQRQIDKALEREKVLFEERCKTGQVLDTQTRFADFAEYWLEKKKDTHSPAYQKRIKSLLVRINAGIGHLQMGKLQPHHLHILYDSLGEPGIKKNGSNAIAHGLAEMLKERRLTYVALAQLAGISDKTVSAACRGKGISLESANKIAHVLQLDIDAVFTVRKSEDPLSGKSVLHHHRIISSIFESAVKWQVIFDNPARRVEAPKAQNKEAAYLDDKQALEVVAALDNAPIKWRTIVMLLAYSGARRGEICGLTWDDIDFTNQIMRITKSNQYLPEMGIFEKGTKTKSSTRTIKLPIEMFTLLKKYGMWQMGERLKMGDMWQHTNKVFTQENGLAIHPDSITGWVAKFRESNNLPYFTPHSLRNLSKNKIQTFRAKLRKQWGLAS